MDATINTVREQVVTHRHVKTVSVTMSLTQAETLLILTGKVGGPEVGRRGDISALRVALIDAGVKRYVTGSPEANSGKGAVTFASAYAVPSV